MLTFRWDPTRDTGAFIKVNCISTEFTPKKHGGEKGVPFRLQVETYIDECGTSITSGKGNSISPIIQNIYILLDPKLFHNLSSFKLLFSFILESGFQPERRLHAASCILQIFKLKGADRKHKQDRDKIHKRPFADQEKFSPSYECTVLTDLPAESIYTPMQSAGNASTSNTAMPQLSSLPLPPGNSTSRSTTPNRLLSSHPNSSTIAGTHSINTAPPLTSKDSSSPTSHNLAKHSPQHLSTGNIYPPTSLECIPILSRNGSPGLFSSNKDGIDANGVVYANNASSSGADAIEHDSSNDPLPPITSNSTPEMVAHWLNKNRYSNHLSSFQYYNGRDILR